MKKIKKLKQQLLRITTPVLFLMIFVVVPASKTYSQDLEIADIKKWDGEYPDMEGSYPLTFIAFKGDLIPIPYVFVRTWPTHYYLNLISLPVTDATAIAGEVKTSLLRIAARLLEQNRMKGRHEKTTAIKGNRTGQKEISLEIFRSRRDSLDDHFMLVNRFVQIYAALARFGTLENSAEIRKIFEVEADGILTRFLMVNLLQADHGEKLQAFSLLRKEQEKLLGEVEYTRQKLCFFTENRISDFGSYAFLTR